MQHEGKLAEILGKSRAGAELDQNVRPAVGLQPSGKLHGSNIPALPVVRAALGDENLVAISKMAKRRRAANRRLQKALAARHENRKRRKRNVLRDDFRDDRERLRVGDDHVGLSSERGQKSGQLRLLDHNAARVAVEHVADRLHLRQDHAPFWSGFVDGRDEHDEPVGAYEVGKKLSSAILRSQRAEALLELENPLARHGTDAQDIRRSLFKKVFLVKRHNVRNVLFAEEREKLSVVFLQTLRPVNHQNGHVRFVEHPLRAQHALLSELLLVVVIARGVDDHDGAQRQKLHGLLHGVGGRSGPPGHDR